MEAVDLILRRNDFSLQLMAIIPAAMLTWLVLILLRQAPAASVPAAVAPRCPIPPHPTC